MLNSDPDPDESIDGPLYSLIEQFADRHRAVAEQVLTGYPLGSEGAISCAGCDADIPEGASITVLARRPCGASTWAVTRVYCAAGAPDRLGSLGGWDAVVDARVGTLADAAEQRSMPAIVAPAAREVSPPTEGTDECLAPDEPGCAR